MYLNWPDQRPCVGCHNNYHRVTSRKSRMYKKLCTCTKNYALLRFILYMYKKYRAYVQKICTRFKLCTQLSKWRYVQKFVYMYKNLQDFLYFFVHVHKKMYTKLYITIMPHFVHDHVHSAICTKKHVHVQKILSKTTKKCTCTEKNVHTFVHPLKCIFLYIRNDTQIMNIKQIL